MTLRSRRLSDITLLAALMVGAPLSRIDAQAANITMPKQAAQRAAGAASARVEAQINQAQGTPGRASTPSQEAAAAQARASRQGGRATPAVVQSGAPTPAGAPDPGARAAGSGATPKPDPANAIMREVFEYGVQGRRDPFFSLLATGDLRPMLSDLKLTTILYDLSGRRPVAVMGDVSTGLQYRVTTGMMLGRMRVTRILPRKVIFAIEEFGFSRADSLVLADKPQTRQ
jgi:hypothetical protein